MSLKKSTNSVRSAFIIGAETGRASAKLFNIYGNPNTAKVPSTSRVEEAVCLSDPNFDEAIRLSLIEAKHAQIEADKLFAKSIREEDERMAEVIKADETFAKSIREEDERKQALIDAKVAHELRIQRFIQEQNANIAFEKHRKEQAEKCKHVQEQAERDQMLAERDQLLKDLAKRLNNVKEILELQNRLI